jgi:SWI/SNF-related matrix-associated actin-dependent regulator of chromatin subfamily A-like protein 1
VLYPYQQIGAEFLACRDRAYLADEMGLGKTVQAIAAAKLRGVNRVLVVAPAATIPNWEAEIERWGDPSWQTSVVSYASRGVKDRTMGHWDVAIIDEAHYVKSIKAQRTRNVFAIDCDAMWLLSGTPMPNHAGEIYTVFSYLFPEMLPSEARSYSGWLNTFTRYRNTRFGPKVYGHKNTDQLADMLRTIMLRRKLSQVGVELPPLRVHNQRLPKFKEFNLDADTQQTLRQMESEEGDENGSLSRVRRLLGKLKSPSIAALIADELQDNAYSQIVILYHHREVGDTLEKELSSFGVARMDGSTTAAQRPVLEAQFRDGDARVFLGQQTAAGTGLNLQSASEIVLVEPSWTPAENLQAIKRVHRLGQDSPCRARMFSVKGTLDEAVMGTLARKTAALKQIID